MPRANTSNQRFDDSVAIAHRTGDTPAYGLRCPEPLPRYLHPTSGILLPLRHRGSQKPTPSAALRQLPFPPPSGPECGYRTPSGMGVSSTPASGPATERDWEPLPPPIDRGRTMRPSAQWLLPESHCSTYMSVSHSQVGLAQPTWARLTGEGGPARQGKCLCVAVGDYHLFHHPLDVYTRI